VYLGLIRNYDALAIGEIMMVDRCCPARDGTGRNPPSNGASRPGCSSAWVLALLAVGLVGNGFMTFETDFWGVVLAAARPRFPPIMLWSVAVHRAGIEAGLDPADIPECERLVQPDAQSRRGDRLGR